MNSATFEAPPSTLRRWIFLVLLIFLAQLVVIYFLSAGKPGQKPGLPSTTVIPLQISPERLTEPQFAEAYLMSDPSLFASANQHGFSGSAWLKSPARAYEQNLIAKSDPPFWLGLNLAQFGSSVSHFVQTNSTALTSFLEITRPQMPLARRSEMVVSTKTNSEFRIEGELTSRELLNPPMLQVWANTNLLSNSIVQVTVDRRGEVISPRLLSRSGYEKADTNALEISRNLQFSPGGTTEIVSGELIFVWQTVPLTATNNEPKTVQP